MDDSIPFDRSMAGKPGEVVRVSPLVRQLIANNGGPFTFTGTCTYLVGHAGLVVIDPGPSERSHHEALMRAIGGSAVTAILVTHSHRDHAPGAVDLKAATGAPVFGPPSVKQGGRATALDASVLDAAHDRCYAPDRVLCDGDTVAGDGFSLTAVETPGHAAHHLCFALPAEAALFSGDHVMAWSTSVVAPPDGSMTAYLASLEKLLGRTEAIYWPGHGGPVLNPQRFVRALLHHRRQREHAIIGRLRAGDDNAVAIAAAIYEALSPALRGAAALSVLAHLDHLERQEKVVRDGEGHTARFRIMERDRET